MEKYSIKLTYKKKEQFRKQKKKQVRDLIRSYSLVTWLEEIRKLNISHGTSGDINIDIKTRGEHLIVCTDMVLRNGRKDAEYPKPSFENINFLFDAEIHLTDDKDNLVKLFGIAAIPFMATWQNRFIHQHINLAGRLELLYKSYNDILLESIGIDTEDLYLILMVLYEIYFNQKKIYFSKESLISPTLKSFTEKKILSFLSFFSITQKDYIVKAKQEKIYENCYGKFKFITRYPIIEVEDNKYTIPVFEQLLETITMNLYFILLEIYGKVNQDESKRFMDEFGVILEDYVVNMAKKRFGKKKVVNANKVVKKADEDRCESVIIYNKQAVAIEVKKMYFRRDTFWKKDKAHIDDLLKRHIVKAFGQIENTLKYINYKSTYGLIVIPDIMLGLSSLRGYIKTEFEGKAHFYDNIFICTLSSYEELMANSEDEILYILNKVKNRDFNEGDDINSVIHDLIHKGEKLSTKNEFLRDAYNDILDELEAKTRSIE